MFDKYLLSSQKLSNSCRLDEFSFETTEELEPLKGIIGQDRAAEALKFGLRVNKRGYNIYVAGLTGTGRNSYTNSITETLARVMAKPNDWMYVYNFEKPNNPKALSFEGGKGEQFKKDIETMVVRLTREIPNIFEGSDYKNKKKNIIRDFQRNTIELLKFLNKTAEMYGFVFKETDHGLMSIPLKDSKPMLQEEYEKLSQSELQKINRLSQELSLETEPIFHKLRQLEESLDERLNYLDREEGSKIISYFIDRLLRLYQGSERIQQWLHSLRDDIVDNISQFKKDEEEDSVNELFESPKKRDFFKRYNVNLFINNKDRGYAPIINETNPSYYNLNGFIEYRNEMGALKTDFTRIRPGSIHMANGGYLILQAKDLLMEPFAWEALKRTLKNNEINIENINKKTGEILTTSLKPEPIPVDVKVIIIGDSYLYHLLYHYDEDFRKLFKIMADFDVEISRTKGNILKMAKFIASHCKEVGLKHFHKSGVARVIEYSSRLADHQQKISSQFNQIVEILYEADEWANIENAKYINKEHVDKAITKKIYRSSKYQEKIHNLFEDGTMLLDVTGKKVGQINGLAVMGTGQYFFGIPNRITVSTYKGKSAIISIEREAKKSGSIHDKGILVLSGYLGHKYAQNQALSLSISISFEQNYSVIDGDSASSTELYAIVSSLANVPIRQGIAVTGSVNQKGEIQPVGGINEKIEGFFDICKIKGLTGEQGVIIPKQNIDNLLLKKEVIKAVEDGQFHIYAIGHVDEGLEILTGIPAGEELNGRYPEGTVNYFVTKRLEEHDEGTV